MHTIGIVANGPKNKIPNLKKYAEKIDLWIGVDQGALTLLHFNLKVSYAIGDFDSVTPKEKDILYRKSEEFFKHPIEKDQTDLEIALEKALSLKPKEIYLFGVTGGRLDHELINLQLLLPVVQRGLKGYIVDQQNFIQLVLPNTYKLPKDQDYPYISFIPFSERVEGLTLEGFYYPLKDQTIEWGSTLCLSNELDAKEGTFFFTKGILIVIKSRD